MFAQQKVKGMNILKANTVVVWMPDELLLDGHLKNAPRGWTGRWSKSWRAYPLGQQMPLILFRLFEPPEGPRPMPVSGDINASCILTTETPLIPYREVHDGADERCP
jgi:hypothetical protein